MTAELQHHGREDDALEAAVSRLSLEPSVSSVTWSTREPDALASHPSVDEDTRMQNAGLTQANR